MAIAEMLRPPLLAASRSSRVENAISRVPVTRKLVDRFVPGVTESDVVTVASGMLDSGRFVTIDHLGEDTTDLGQARTTVSHYLQLLEGLAPLTGERADGAPNRIEVSLKLSALGQFLPQDGHRIALDHAHRICSAAAAAGIWVTVDAEDHTTTDSTLSIVNELRADHPWLGTVLQAYLLRTEADCREFAGAGSRIRLCKGAYSEPAAVAHQAKEDVDAAYLRCLRILMEGRGYPMVASHDPAMIGAALRLAAENGRGTDDFELQMLYGIRDGEQLRQIGEGRHLRVYLPYGQQWYGYFMRRLAERPQNLTFFLRSLVSKN